MEQGFDEISNDNYLDGSSKAKIYLFRVPKDVDTSILHGTTLKLSHIESHDRIATINHGDMSYDVRKDMYQPTIRPIVKDRIVNGCTVGSSFRGCMYLAKKFTIKANITPPSSADHSLDHLPITLAYTKLDQISDLTVRSLPQGSLSTLDELKARRDENDVIHISQQQQHKRSHYEVDHTSDDEKAKKKSSKKEKKSKKEHR